MLIGITGNKFAGKDTVADLFVARGFKKVAFAEPIKKICTEVYGLSIFQVHDPKLKEQMDIVWGMTPRKLMQEVGDKLRAVHRDTFINYVTDYIAHNGSSNIVVSDIRGPREAEALRRLGAIIIRVRRVTPHVDTHVTETEVSKVEPDHIIRNNRDKEALAEKVSALMEELAVE